MKNNQLFIDGVTAVRKGYYEKALQIFSVLYNNYYFEEDVIIYYGYILYKLNDIKKAKLIWSKLHEVGNDKEKALLTEAFILAKNYQFERALKIWLSLSKNYKNNKICKSILNNLKKSRSNKSFINSLTYKSSVGKLPLYNIKKSLDIKVTKKIPIFVFSILIVFISLVFINKYFMDFSLFKLEKTSSNINTSYLPINNQLSNENKIHFVYNSENEIKNDFEKIKKNISKNEYNKSVMLINKILNSNASLKTIEKVKLFNKFLIEPGFRTIKYNPTYDEIKEAPYLYKNVFVKWKGVINVLNSKEFEISIFEKSRIFIHGIIKAKLRTGDISIYHNNDVEFLGKIINYENNTINIEVTSVSLLYNSN